MAATDTLSATPKRIDLPRDGYSVYYRDDKHWYQRVNDRGLPGTRYPGASTIGSAFPDRPDGLMKWAARTDREGISRLVKSVIGESKVWNDLDHHELVDRLGRLSTWTDPYALLRALERQGLAYDQQRDAAADRGKGVHEKMLEALALGGDVPDLDTLPSDDQGYGQAVFRWWQERNPEPLNVEQVVLSMEHGYAGRFDLRCRIESQPFDQFHGVGIVDLKTGRSLYRKDHVQLRLYEIAARECGVGDADWLMLLQVGPDGTYIEQACAATEDDALLAVRAHKAANAMSNRMRGAK